jgi:flagellar basal body-associated protein FliL
MKFFRVLILLLLAAVILFTVAGVYSSVVTAQKERSAHSKKPAQFHYVCPMHEDVTSKTRGKKCPKCKMKLEKKKIKEAKPPDQ